MTHTIADAEAAIARHPEDLEELSRAADLLIERNYPRGEDFAACLAGDLSPVELQRRHPADVYAMFVAAWAIGYCPSCSGSGLVSYEEPVYGGTVTQTCSCRASDPEARAEALRLLAACGKVGSGRFGYGLAIHPRHENMHARVCRQWYDSAAAELDDSGDPVQNRLALLDAYAAADPDTRRRWADETRALTAKEEVTP